MYDGMVVWLDNDLDENNEDYHRMIDQLQRIFNTIKKFTDGEECIEFINRTNDEMICMIIKDSFGQQIVPRVHNMSHVNSIFIHSNNAKQFEQWIKEWPKVKNIFTEISSIYEALKQVANQCEQKLIPISFITTDDNISNKNFDALDYSFIFTHILKEILLNIKFTEEHIKEFLQYCEHVYINNKEQLINVKELEQNYQHKSPIWWYRCGNFLSSMLNHALRLMDIDVIIKIGFFIIDLHRHIEQLHKEQCINYQMDEIFTVYRGQALLKVNFEKMIKTNGGLMSFNNFLSSSKNRDISIDLARSALSNSDMVGILFVITIDPSKSTTPFASIKGLSDSVHEDEILFSIHSVFRIHDIKQMDENPHLFQVNLTFISNNDKDLCALNERIREEIDSESNEWYKLSKFLVKIDQLEKAQEIYEVQLERTTNDIEKAFIYDQIGSIKDLQGESTNEVIIFYEKALEIRQQSLLPNDLELTTSYDKIGGIYYNIGDYSKALLSYEKALEIKQKSLPPNHPHIAESYNNIGAVQDNMGEYSKALLSYENAHKIWQQSLPPNHPDLSTSYNNIGNVYHSMGEESKALLYFEKSLHLREQSLPSNHPDLAKSYITLGMVSNVMSEYSKAITFYEYAIEIQKQSLPSNHLDLAISYNNIGNVYDNMGNYSKALCFYVKAVEIQKQSVPSNHPDLAVSFNNIGLVYENMGDYLKASSLYQYSIDIAQQSLPSNHPHLQMYKNNIEVVKRKLELVVCS